VAGQLVGRHCGYSAVALSVPRMRKVMGSIPTVPPSRFLCAFTLSVAVSCVPRGCLGGSVVSVICWLGGSVLRRCRWLGGRGALVLRCFGASAVRCFGGSVVWWFGGLEVKEVKVVRRFCALVV